MNRTLKLVLLLLIVTNNSFKVIANDESKVVTSFYSQSVYLDKYFSLLFP